jgi:predicted ATP-binding protein involved in virulence
MKLRHVIVQNFRAIRQLVVPLDAALTVLHGNNAHGKTSLLAAIAIGLGQIPTDLGRKGGINFRKSDRRAGTGGPVIGLESSEGMAWQRHGTTSYNFVRDKTGKVSVVANIRKHLLGLAEAIEQDPTTNIPVFAFYDTDRAVLGIPESRRGFRREFHRFDAYIDALARKTSFKTLVEWFYASENDELRWQREEKNFDLRSPKLEAVRNAIIKMMPDVSNPHIEPPVQFVVERTLAGRGMEKLSLEQLSGGYRIVLAMAADLALRMALANPHLADPLQSEAIVLIDEIELHLHPEWQQRILSDLRRTFPNAQFIVSTHSPQVLTTVEPQHIVHLRATEDGIVAEQETGPTYGAKAGDVLQAVMGVAERPDNDFTKLLKSYRTMIANGSGETPGATQMRADLERLSLDPQLAALDIEIARRRVMRELAAKR